jgi:hypothetical protein
MPARDIRMRHCAVIVTVPAALAGVTVVVHRQTDDAISIAYRWFDAS